MKKGFVVVVVVVVDVVVVMDRYPAQCFRPSFSVGFGAFYVSPPAERGRTD